MMTRLAFVWVYLLASCSLIVDKSETQCTVDSDCDHFGNHPSCQQGVCVDSGLGPPGCFFGTPMQPSDFANQCTVSDTFQYDNCMELNLCGSSALAGAMTTNISPGSNAGKVAAPVNNQPTPTVMCSALPSAGVASAVMYITGSTNLPPLIKAVQPLLYANSPSYAAIFVPQTSCAGAASIYVGGSNAMLFDVVNNYAFYYDASGNQQFCLLGSAGEPVDVGESDVYPSTCSSTYTDTPTIADYTGPVQAITFVVPAGSTQKAISAEAAHLVFAAGGDSVVKPWNNPELYFVRSSGTGTVQLPSKVISAAPTMWWGFDRLSAGNLVESMEAVTPSDAEASIGVLSNDYADRSRANLTELAFQQAGQTYGYLPDSTPTSLDKMNVRDGHYPVWGQIHLLAPVVGGEPSQAASALVTQFTVPKLDQNLVTAIIQAGFIPTCAMQVSHTSEVGALSQSTPTFGCGCYFDATTGSTVPSECTTCATAATCPSSRPACNYGYCEVQ